MKAKYITAEGELKTQFIESKINEIEEKMHGYLDQTKYKKIRSNLYYLRRVCASDKALSNKVNELIKTLKQNYDDSIPKDINGVYIDNYRIVKLDDLNYTYDIYREVKSKQGTSEFRWVNIGGYYGSIEVCINSLKSKIVGDYLQTRKMKTDEFVKLLEKMKTLYVDMIIKVKE
jgi:hypothetical protein